MFRRALVRAARAHSKISALNAIAPVATHASFQGVNKGPISINKRSMVRWTDLVNTKHVFSALNLDLRMRSISRSRSCFVSRSDLFVSLCLFTLSIERVHALL
jgi:hypothetical protein